MKPKPLVDPATFVGKRVFISTKKEWYIGTLQDVREWAIEIIDWVQVGGYSDSSMKITSYGDKGRTSKIIMHSGGGSELETIELNRYSGDPFMKKEASRDPFAKEEDQGDVAFVEDASSYNDENDEDFEIPNEVFDVLFPTNSEPPKKEDPEDEPKWLTETPQISDRSKTGL